MSIFQIAIVTGLSVLLLLILASVYARKQQKQAEKRHQARLLRRRILDLNEGLDFLIRMDNNKEIRRAVLTRMDQLTKKYLELEPAPGELKTMPDLEVLSQIIEHQQRPKKVLKSNGEIRYAKRQVSQIMKALPVLQKTRALSEAAVMEHRRYLKIFLVEVEADSYLAQGDVAAKRGDVTTANNYYKIARKRLLDFNIRYPEKAEKVEAISKRMAALFKGQDQIDKEAQNLAEELSKEGQPKVDENGFPIDPMNMVKQKF